MRKNNRISYLRPDGKSQVSIEYDEKGKPLRAHTIAVSTQHDSGISHERIRKDVAIYGVSPEAVTKNMRRHAKAINFGLIYGMSSFGLTRTTELTLAEAEEFVKAYFKQFPGIKKYLDGIRRLAAQQGYVETLLGRRRYFPALQSKQNVQVKNREEREAINAPIQGTAADIMKISMIRIPPALQTAGLKGKMLLQVHDELVLEVPEKEIRETALLVQETMANAYPLSIPLSTEARYEKNWGDMNPI